jgi:ribosomal protein S18 acetylase RimI-like enzyme
MAARPSHPVEPVIDVEPFRSHAVQHVVAQAENELIVRYGSLDQCESGLTELQFDPPSGAFLVGRLVPGGPPVGGVGLRSAGPGIGEIKRLWVAEAWRGRGIARSLMSEVEVVARTKRLFVLRLETGWLQPEAVALYASSGWEQQSEDWEGGEIRVGSIHFAKVLAPH